MIPIVELFTAFTADRVMKEANDFIKGNKILPADILQMTLQTCYIPTTDQLEYSILLLYRKYENNNKDT